MSILYWRSGGKTLSKNILLEELKQLYEPYPYPVLAQVEKLINPDNMDYLTRGWMKTGYIADAELVLTIQKLPFSYSDESGRF